MNMENWMIKKGGDGNGEEKERCVGFGRGGE